MAKSDELCWVVFKRDTKVVRMEVVAEFSTEDDAATCCKWGNLIAIHDSVACFYHYACIKDCAAVGD